MPAPTLHTERLTLRGHVMADLDRICDLFETERARFMGGPLPRKETWRWVASEVGMWDLLGHGAWGIDTKDGMFVGQIGLLKPPHFPELELGWTLLAEAEGKGYATEAAKIVLDWVRDELRPASLVSYIDPANTRSIALAERLGATHDPKALLPLGETAEETVVFRHPLDADGGPEAYA